MNKTGHICAEDIYGPEVGFLRGKTTRRNTGNVKDVSHAMLPLNVIDNYKQISLCADIIFINKITLMISIS